VTTLSVCASWASRLIAYRIDAAMCRGWALNAVMISSDVVGIGYHTATAEFLQNLFISWPTLFVSSKTHGYHKCSRRYYDWHFPSLSRYIGKDSKTARNWCVRVSCCIIACSIVPADVFLLWSLTRITYARRIWGDTYLGCFKWEASAGSQLLLI